LKKPPLITFLANKRFVLKDLIEQKVMDEQASTSNTISPQLYLINNKDIFESFL